MWTHAKDRAILTGVATGLSASQIAENIGGGCTRNAVIGRHHRLRKTKFPYIEKIKKVSRAKAENKRRAYALHVARCIEEFDRRIARGEQRNWVITSIRARGVHLVDLARHVGVTHQRIQQICERAA